MKLPVTSFFLLALAGAAFAGTPEKPPLQTYRVLWSNSPFTTKPGPTPQDPPEDPLKDYSLIGVSPIGGDNYRVTLINKKKPDERIMVFSDSESSDFKILGVNRKPGDPLGTVVSLASGSMKGTVTYDEKLLILVTPVVAKPPVPQPGMNPDRLRHPRPRVAPPTS